MNREQFAEMLNGREYGSEITDAEEKLAEESGLLVCFGYSDDNLEFRGVIENEVSAYDGGSGHIVKTKRGNLHVISKSEMDDVIEVLEEHSIGTIIPSVVVEAEWCPSDPKCSWLISSDLPHSTFDIMEDGELFCRGIVIDKTDIENAI